IQSVEYSDAPEELQAGIDTLAAGNPQDALPLLETALTAEGNRPLIVQQALFHLAYAQQRQGMAEASASYAKLLADFPKGRYLRQAAENLLELRLATNDVAGAQGVIKSLSEGAKGLDGIDALTGLLEARLLEGQGKAAEADQRFSAVAALAGAPP